MRCCATVLMRAAAALVSATAATTAGSVGSAARCEFTHAGRTMSLASLPAEPFRMADRQGALYTVVSPCWTANGTGSPAVETSWPKNNTGRIQLGLPSHLRCAHRAPTCQWCSCCGQLLDGCSPGHQKHASGGLPAKETAFYAFCFVRAFYQHGLTPQRHFDGWRHAADLCARRPGAWVWQGGHAESLVRVFQTQARQPAVRSPSSFMDLR